MDGRVRGEANRPGPPGCGRARAALLLGLTLVGLALGVVTLPAVAVLGFRSAYEPTGDIPVIGPLVGSVLGLLVGTFAVLLAAGALSLVVVLAALATRPWRSPASDESRGAVESNRHDDHDPRVSDLRG